MSFLNPQFLHLLFAPMILFLYFGVMKKGSFESLFDKNILLKLKVNAGTFGRRTRNAMLFLSLFLIVIALARPAQEKAELTINSSSIDMLVALDISRSMFANDVYPSRFDFAKKRFFEFMKNFKNANIGVIAFGDVGFMVSPMSSDYATVKYLVENLSANSINSFGTDFFVPLDIAKRSLKDKKEKIVIMFTDGGDSKDFQKEIDAAKELGAKIYIYSVGTDIGGSIEDNGEMLKDKNGNIVIVKLNEAVKKLALSTGGAYIKSGYDKKGVELLAKEIKSSFGKGSVKEKTIKEYQELFWIPLSIAILLLLLAFSSLPFKKSGLKNIMAFLFLSLFLFSGRLDAGILDFMDIKKAKEHYEKGEFDKSSKIYKKLSNSKKDASSYYNLANSYYKEKKYKKAIENYEKIKTEDKDMNFKNLYNTANAHAKLQNYDKAISLYEKSLKIKEDEDARHNLELLKNMKKNKQNKKDQKDKQQKQDKKNDKKQNSKDSKKDKDGKKQEQKEGKNGDKDKDGQNKKSDQDAKKDSDKSKSPDGKNKKMSDAEERKWTKMMEKRRPKTLPMKIETEQREIKNSKNPW